jgi:pyruvate/2-oxoacid:ferredoxin oxidoreductase alpha subunit
LKHVTKPVRVVQVLWMEPMDVERVSLALSGASRIIAIELNHNAQCAGLVREKTGITVTDMILKYDARPFEPVALAEKLNALLA